MSKDKEDKPPYVIHMIAETQTAGIESSTYGGVFAALSHLVGEHHMAMNLESGIESEIEGVRVRADGSGGYDIDVRRTYHTRVGLMSMKDLAEKATSMQSMFGTDNSAVPEDVMARAMDDDDFDFVDELFTRAFHKNLTECAKKAVSAYKDLSPAERDKKMRATLATMDNFNSD